MRQSLADAFAGELADPELRDALLIVVHESGHSVALKHLIGPVITSFQFGHFLDADQRRIPGAVLGYTSTVKLGVSTREEEEAELIAVLAGVVAESVFLGYKHLVGFSPLDRGICDAILWKWGVPGYAASVVVNNAACVAEKLLRREWDEVERVGWSILKDHRPPLDYYTEGNRAALERLSRSTSARMRSAGGGSRCTGPVVVLQGEVVQPGGGLSA